MISAIFYVVVMKKESLFLKSVSLTERVERKAERRGYKSLLELTFCINLVREILFLSGRSQGILKSDVRGNHGRESSLTYDGNTSTHGHKNKQKFANIF